MLVLVYTGPGKGKTSASVGQAIRAHGQGLKVAFGQFMKRDVKAGEQNVLQILLKERFFIGGCGFFMNESEKHLHRTAALEVLGWVRKQLTAELHMLVLDEALYALGSGLVEAAELRTLIAECRDKNVHLVLSGRGLPAWLADEADLITELGEVKHHYNEGIQAQKGIEF